MGFFKCLGVSTPFYWSEATGLLKLPSPPNVLEARAYAINNNGQITGIADSPWRGFMIEADGTVVDFGIFPPEANLNESLALNEHGTAAGFWSNNVTGPSHGFLWNGGRITDLQMTIAAPSSRAYAINNDDTVAGKRTLPNVGVSAFIWNEGTTTDLGIPTGASDSIAWVINDHNTVAGTATFDGPPIDRRVWIWRPGALVLLDIPGVHTQIRPLGINDKDQIVGYASTFGFLWDRGCIHDLNDLVPASFERTINFGDDINEHGEIVVSGGDYFAILVPTGASPADVDGDCDADTQDLLVLLSAWNGDGPADLSCDGVVNLIDLLLLLANWTS